jgi:cystathionine beta-synthase
MRIADSAPGLIGGTPMLDFPLPAWCSSQLLLKLELLNLTGAMKVRPALSMIRAAEESGDLMPGGTIVEASSGNTAVALAMIAAASWQRDRRGRPGRQYRLIAIVDDNCSAGKVAAVEAYGGKVKQIPCPPGGLPSPDKRVLVARELAAEIPGGWYAGQSSNPANPAGYATLAAELLVQIPGVNTLVGALGTGGSLCGTARELRKTGRDITVVGVEPEGSIYFGPPGPFLQAGTGRPEGASIPVTFDRSQIDEPRRVGDAPAFTACRFLAQRCGLLAGGSAGSVFLAAIEFAVQYRDRIIAAILPDAGDKYLDTIHAPSWLEAHDLYHGETWKILCDHSSLLRTCTRRSGTSWPPSISSCFQQRRVPCRARCSAHMTTDRPFTGDPPGGAPTLCTSNVPAGAPTYSLIQPPDRAHTAAFTQRHRSAC